MANIITKLDTHYTDKDTGKVVPIPKFILGDDQNAYFEEIMAFVEATRHPNSFIGDPGTGKTHFMRQAVIAYAQRHECEALWCTVDPETMRSTLIGGHRFEDGSEVPFLAVAGYALKYGHAVAVDELTHGEVSVQGGFNSSLDMDAKWGIGDMVVQGHPRARFFFGFNGSLFPGNCGLMTSFAMRSVQWPFEYPSPKSEALIAKSIAAQSLGNGNIREGAKKIKTPDGVVKFLVSWAREMRAKTNNMLPIAARNVAMMIEMLSLLPYDENAAVPDDWEYASSGEAIRRMVAERIYFQPVQFDTDLRSKIVNDTLQFIVGVKRERFVKVALQCAGGYYANIENIPLSSQNEWREVMAASVI